MVKSVITKKGYSIFLDSIEKKELDILKKDLTVKPIVISSYDFGDDASFPVYRLSETKIFIPRFYGINKYGDVKNKIIDGLKVDNLTFGGELKDHQINFCDTILKELDKNNSCIACSQTGSGKTIMALWLVSKLKTRTMIVVHKTFLLDQWIERIRQFLPNASIGIVQQNKCEVDKDIIIGMIQTLTTREFPSGTFDSIGTCVLDECFVYDQFIITEKGPMKIGILYYIYKQIDKFLHLAVLPRVLSYNEYTNTFEFKNITFAWENTNKNIIKISYENGKIECTTNHKILTPSGYVEACKLNPGDLIRCNFYPFLKNPIAQDLNDDQYQILLGCFLGDGNIDVLSSGRYKLSVYHLEKYKDYCGWKSKMFNCGFSKTGNIYKFQTEIFDLIGDIPNTKMSCPQWVIDGLDYRGLAVWYMDNLSFYEQFIDTFTCPFDKESHGRIVEKLVLMGIPCYYTGYEGYSYITILNINDLLDKIKKYIHTSFNIVDVIGELYIWNYSILETGTLKILSIVCIKNSDELGRVYDLEVEDNHNFVLSVDQYPEISMCGPIVHNCHHLAAQGFSKLFFKIGTKKTLALSATPKRADGLTKVLEWFLGSMVVNKISSDVEIPMVKFIDSEYSNIITPKFNFNGNLNAPNLINQIVLDPARNQQIIDEIIRLNKEGRKILVLSGRRSHCVYIHSKLIEINIDSGLYLGGMSNESLGLSNRSRVVLATYSMASEAYDNPDLDSLIMATGMSSVQQSIGRILRKKNKFKPLVVDFTDIGFFVYQARVRKQFYKKNGYECLKDDIREKTKTQNSEAIFEFREE